MRLAPGGGMTHRSILVATDFTTSNESAVRGAFALATQLGVHSVHLVHVLPSPPRPISPLPNLSLPAVTRGIEDQAIATAERKLASIAAGTSEIEIVRRVMVGAPIDELLRAVEEMSAELMVLGTHRRAGLARVLHGSVSSVLIRRAPCPVTVFAEGQEIEAPLREVMVAVDLSPPTRELIQHAASMFAGKPGRLVIVAGIAVPSPFALSHPSLSGTLDYGDLEQHGDEVRESILELLEDLPKTIDARVEIIYEEPAAA
jgi:nucleotide-binding universal stress UspA family protein